MDLTPLIMKDNISSNLKKPELAAPAGGWSSLYSAIEAGADAVYFGVKGLNMRHSAENFDTLEIPKIMDLLRGEGKKGYLVLNTLVYDNELAKVKSIIEKAASSGVDAVILWDMAVLSLVRAAGLKVHLSTQASVANFEALKFYSSLGVERLVLARECALSDIRNIITKASEENIKCDVETFIHGAMCVSISGRCFLSHESFSSSANRGECAQPCRREFKIIAEDADKECSYVLGSDYILSSKDLCTINFIDRLIMSGISAFKIEGRMRPPEYVKEVTSAYRTAIDAFFAGGLDDALKEELFKKLGGVFNRGLTSGFYLGEPDSAGVEPERGYKKTFLGEVIKFYKKIGVAEIAVMTDDLKAGQKILITGKRTPACFTEVVEMQVHHKPVELVRKGSAAGVKVPCEVRPRDKVFLWEESSEC